MEKLLISGFQYCTEEGSEQHHLQRAILLWHEGGNSLFDPSPEFLKHMDSRQNMLWNASGIS
jgi:hypothetical protein